ncbi:hypothetical protein HZ326_17079 [Fusarium oxysporum f. sp. albedinis]|nr:hypothetical protein HZ326_17079 [Fusarium oxysporum f. sp. albedinis]
MGFQCQYPFINDHDLLYIRKNKLSVLHLLPASALMQMGLGLYLGHCNSNHINPVQQWKGIFRSTKFCQHTVDI